MTGMASAAIYSVIVPIAEVTGLTVAGINAGTGYFVSLKIFTKHLFP
jgi:hypothetical protein